MATGKHITQQELLKQKETEKVICLTVPGCFTIVSEIQLRK